jgi:LDH2 family malate/lactate/ureidoglycolate dehydrogenase
MAAFRPRAHAALRADHEDAMTELRIPFARLQQFAVSAFVAAGLPEDDARIAADSLVMSDLRGTYSHGIVRLPFLVERLTRGGANARPNVRVVKEAAATALLDGDRALGPVTATRAMELAMTKARSAGIGMVAARNSDFIGACAHYAMMALPREMIGIAWTNGYPGMAPWGGRSQTIGNNPIAFAAPGGAQGPVVLDMALSVAAGGRIRLAAKRQERIPNGWLIDRDGQHTDDPGDLVDGGALLPLGYKGYGLAVFGEILCGVLTGSRILSEVPAWFVDTEREIGNGHLHIAIDIARFVAPAAFGSRVEDLARMLKATPRIPGVEEILLPGERAWRASSAQANEGIRIPREVVADLDALARRLGLDGLETAA